MYYLTDITRYRIILILLPIFLVNSAIVPQEKLSLLMAQGQQGQDNASATDMENLETQSYPKQKR
jgi:hypothetical protein